MFSLPFFCSNPSNTLIVEAVMNLLHTLSSMLFVIYSKAMIASFWIYLLGTVKLAFNIENTQLRWSDGTRFALAMLRRFQLTYSTISTLQDVSLKAANISPIKSNPSRLRSTISSWRTCAGDGSARRFAVIQRPECLTEAALLVTLCTIKLQTLDGLRMIVGSISPFCSSPDQCVSYIKFSMICISSRCAIKTTIQQISSSIYWSTSF